MKNNCQGFVMIETLIVTTFVVVIFTFMYTSIVPLLGTYENLESQSNIDNIYRIYAIRRELYKDSDYFQKLNNNYGKLTTIDNATLKEILNIQSGSSSKYDIQNITLYYVKNIRSNKVAASNNVKEILTNEEAKKLFSDYIKNYNDVPENVLFMYSEENLNDKLKPNVVCIGLAPDLTKPYVYHS